MNETTERKFRYFDSENQETVMTVVRWQNCFGFDVTLANNDGFQVFHISDDDIAVLNRLTAEFFTEPLKERFNE